LVVATALATASIAVLIASRPAAAAVGSWVEHPEVKLRLVAGVTRAARQGPLALGLEFVTAKEWHVYWKNPGDAGFPMATESRSPALGDLRVAYPAPHRFDLPGDLQAFGYEGAVVYPLDATLAAPAGGERQRLSVGVDFLTCKIECVPYRDVVELELPIADRESADPDVAALLDSWRARVPRPVSAAFRVTASLAEPATGALATFSFAGAVSAASELFLESHRDVDFGKAMRRSGAPAGGATFDVPLRPRQRREGGLAPLDLAWTLTAVGPSGDHAIDGVARLERVAITGDAGGGNPHTGRVDPPSPSFGPAKAFAGVVFGLAALLSFGLWVARSR
jgi:DsbC/DsbD-like thiol-disulfide interchange protein